MRETQRCKTIIQGLLEFARDRQPQKVLANANDILENALSIVSNEFHLRHVRIEKQLVENMANTMLDKAQIEQVFVNLLLNALQAVTENGRVTVRSTVDWVRERIEVEVADNGCGIAADDIKKIFDPFYSTRTDGTGLGLSVSYGIIQNHGGDIQVFSEPGQDTHFKVVLPILVEKADGKGAHETAQSSDH